MDLVGGLVFVCIFLISLCAVQHYSRRSPLPTVCWFVLFGIAYGVINKTMALRLPPLLPSPDTIFYIFLPVLIFDASRKLDLHAARAELLPAAMLATLGILASMYLMAIPILLMTELPLIDILFFTAIMSATVSRQVL